MVPTRETLVVIFIRGRGGWAAAWLAEPNSK